MKRQVFVLAVETAAAAYLFYYVMATGGRSLAGMAAAVLALKVIAEWSQVFYRLGLGSARPRGAGNR